ncbi:MAG: ABC-2 transporter permease [Firmicutes bacterium]|nr:ABC-2 transporter permease [Bacillota bacterium]
MLGFIKKDIIMLKSNFKTLAILIVVYIIMAFKGIMDISFILPFISVMIMISTFSYDEFNKWNSYACTLPNGRKNVVKSKYISTLLMIIITTFIVGLVSFIITYTQTQKVNYEEILSIILGTSFATILLESFMYPTIYKFGVEKARIGIFVSVFGIAIIGGLLSNIFNFRKVLELLKLLENYIIIIIPIIMVVMLYISYKISERINLNKEF